MFQEPLTQLRTQDSASPGTRRAVKGSQHCFQRGANSGCAWNTGKVTPRSQRGGGGYRSSLSSTEMLSRHFQLHRHHQNPALACSSWQAAALCSVIQPSSGLESRASSRHSPCPQPVKAGEAGKALGINPGHDLNSQLRMETLPLKDSSFFQLSAFGTFQRESKCSGSHTHIGFLSKLCFCS